MAIISPYWASEGAEDKAAGYPPKTESFFTAWFGDSGVRIHAAYLRAYNAMERDK